MHTDTCGNQLYSKKVRRLRASHSISVHQLSMCSCEFVREHLLWYLQTATFKSVKKYNVFECFFCFICLFFDIVCLQLDFFLILSTFLPPIFFRPFLLYDCYLLFIVFSRKWNLTHYLTI